MANNLHEKFNLVLQKAKDVVYGQDDLLEGIMAALVCEGHLLIEGMPGLGKTLSVSTISKLCDLSFKRIQFTPDLLPSDLIGTVIYSQQSETFQTKFGPLFTQLLLADEINRSPAKIQSALLEAMAEKQVTIGETTYPLKAPFVVMATQNPIDQEGTYPLPEAQLDRFMMKVYVNYPDHDSEVKILDGHYKAVEEQGLLSTDDILEIQNKIQEIYVDPKIKELIINMVRATRPSDPLFPKELDGVIFAGASPRAGIWLHKLGKYQAFLNGRDFVNPEHLLKVIPSVLGHRVILTYEAMIDKIVPQDIVKKVAESLV